MERYEMASNDYRITWYKQHKNAVKVILIVLAFLIVIIGFYFLYR